MPLVRKTGIRSPWLPAPMQAAIGYVRPVTIVTAVIPSSIFAGNVQVVSRLARIEDTTRLARGSVVIIGQQPIYPIGSNVWVNRLARLEDIQWIARKPLVVSIAQPYIASNIQWLKLPLAALSGNVFTDTGTTVAITRSSISDQLNAVDTTLARSILTNSSVTFWLMTDTGKSVAINSTTIADVLVNIDAGKPINSASASDVTLWSMLDTGLTQLILSSVSTHIVTAFETGQVIAVFRLSGSDASSGIVVLVMPTTVRLLNTGKTLLTLLNNGETQVTLND